MKQPIVGGLLLLAAMGTFAAEHAPGDAAATRDASASLSNAPESPVSDDAAPDEASPDNASLNGMPLNGMPLNGMPLNGAPLNGAPLNGAPLNGSPSSAKPLDGAASHRISPQSASAGSPSVPTTVLDATAVDCCRLPSGTLLFLELGEAVSSARHKRGDKFVLRLREAVRDGGSVVIPAGASGVGEVVHAAPAKGGGKPGELLLAGRYLEFAGQQWSLRGMKVGVSGQHNYNVAFALGQAVGPFAMFVRGREIEVPMGTPVAAKLAQELYLPALDQQALAAYAAGLASAAGATPAASPDAATTPGTSVSSPLASARATSAATATGPDAATAPTTPPAPSEPTRTTDPNQE